jgi:hypothetical protein
MWEGYIRVEPDQTAAAAAGEGILLLSAVSV